MKLERTKVLLSGGTGFLGHHIVRALLDRQADIILLIQPQDKTWRLEPFRDKVRQVPCRLTHRDETRSAIQKNQPEVIIHLAGRMERRRDLSILDDLMDHHVSSTINVMLASDPATTKLVIHTGTSEEYGEQEDPFVETLPVDPVSPYSATKASATALATYLSKAIGIPVITMRPFITYGPGQLHDTLIPFLIKGVLQKKTVELTEGLQYRDFIFVDDLVACYLAAIERAEAFAGPEVFNIGSGKKIQIREVIEGIADLLDGHAYLKIGARPMRAGEPPSMIASIAKAKARLGWKPKIPLHEGLRRTIDWWLENEGFWRDS
jgi:nucleoside-diphosphate-sugar epimerase